MENVVLLTGATGLIGGNLAVRILRQFHDTRLIVLVRGRSSEEASRRFWTTIRTIDPELRKEEYVERTRIIRGNVDAHDLGLSPADRAVIRDSVTHIIHSAASVKFHLPLEEVRAINVCGTTHILALANDAYRHGRLRRFGYISTAYVSGTREGTVLESDLQHSGFANTYEQSKYETEQMVRLNAGNLPTIIFRPSIVVGNSQTGITTSFNVLYVPLRLLIQGMINMLPGSASVPLDVVPVDFVRDAICHIMFGSRECIGKTFHLTSGEESVTTGEIIRLVEQWYKEATHGQAEVNLRFVSAEAFTAATMSKRGGSLILKMLAPFQSYLSYRRTFDTTNLRSALKGSGIIAPPFREYYRAMMSYFVASLPGRDVRHAA
ncbi:MAG: SDR family oxidoreductase [Bacteroidota bacterium]